MTKATGGQIQQIAAATNSGEGGACLFAVDRRGRISFTQQAGPGGPWQDWQGPQFMGQPASATALACAQQNNGCLMLVMLTTDGSLWSTSQNGPSGVWNLWQGPKIAGQRISFKAIAAGGQTGARGILLIALDVMGAVWICYQARPGAEWSDWSHFAAIGREPVHIAELVLSGQNNGCLMLMAGAEGIITAVPQARPSGDWGAWTAVGQNGFTTRLFDICACQQGGNRGVQFWGLDYNGQIWTVFQDTAGGDWDPWQGPGFIGQPGPFVDLAAADQNNGSTMLFAVTRTGDLWITGQHGPAGGWDPWRQIPTITS
jgi:hypothetical protein